MIKIFLKNINIYIYNQYIYKLQYIYIYIVILKYKKYIRIIDLIQYILVTLILNMYFKFKIYFLKEKYNILYIINI